MILQGVLMPLQPDLPVYICHAIFIKTSGGRQHYSPHNKVRKRYPSCDIDSHQLYIIFCNFGFVAMAIFVS
jgi:hypothetical protein